VLTTDEAADDIEIVDKPSSKKIKTSHTPHNTKKYTIDMYNAPSIPIFNPYPPINAIDAAKSITAITETAMNCTDEIFKEKLIKTADFIMEKAVSLSVPSVAQTIVNSIQYISIAFNTFQ
jgi:hypothetical protein